MKKKTLKQTTQKEEGSQEIIRNNCMTIKWITWNKWTRFLEKYNLLRLNQEEIENMNKSSTNTNHKL